jgi:hypothetical protein
LGAGEGAGTERLQRTTGLEKSLRPGGLRERTLEDGSRGIPTIIELAVVDESKPRDRGLCGRGDGRGIQGRLGMGWSSLQDHQCSEAEPGKPGTMPGARAHELLREEIGA